MKSKLPSKPASRKPEGNKNQYFHLLFENNPLPMWVYDLETLSFLGVNEAAVELYGYSRDEFLKLRITDICPSEDVQFVEKQAKAQRARLKYSGEWRHCKKDGSIICVVITSHKLTYEGHKAALVAARDITKQKQTENLMLLNQERFKVALNTIDIAVFNQDTDLRYTWMQQPQLGYVPQDVLGKTDAELLPSRDASLVMAIKRNVIETGHGAHEEVSIHMPDRVLVYDLIVEPLKDENGKIVGLTGASFDITQRKNAEQVMIQSEAKYRALVEQLPTVVYINPADDPSSTIFISPQIKTMLGYNQAEWLADPKLWAKSLHPEDRQRILAESERMIASGEGTNVEYRIVARDGRVVWVRDQAVLVHDVEGNPKFWQGVMIDVTEQRQAGQALSASEKRFRALIENASDIIIVIDADGIVSYASPSLTRLLGYSQEEVLGKAFTDWVHPDDLQRAAYALSKRKQFVGTDIEPVTFRLRHCDGSWHSIEGVGNNLLDNPSVGGIVMNCRDVTERKQAEEALRQSEERFRNLYENSAIGIYRTTPDGHILLSNPALVQMLGYDSFEELAKRNLEKDGNDADYRHGQFIEMIERNGEVHGLESKWRRKDGTTIFVRESARLIRDQDGRVLYYDGTVEDITEKKRAEESQRATEEKYRALVENVSAIFYVDAVDDLSSTIYISPQVETLLGYKPEEWTTNPNFWRTVIHPDDYAAWQAENIRTNQTGEPFKMEYRLVARDGHIVWTNDEAVLIRDAAGQPLYWQGVHFDITDRKLAEEALTASEAELSAILASMPDVVLVLDKEGRYLKIAPTNPDLLHQPAEMMLGKRMHEVFSRQKADELVGHIREALDKKQTIHFEYALLLGDCITWFSGTTSPLTEDSVVWVGRDITARKLAEDALLASQDLLKDAQRIAHIGSWELDLKTNVLAWSDEIYRMFEIDPEAFGASYEAFLDSIHPDDRAMVDQAYTDSVKNKTPYSITHRLLFPDGQIKFVHERCETIYNGIGEPVRSIGTVQDITERKLAEDTLQQRIKELSLIYETSQRLRQILTPETLADELIGLLKGLLNYEHGVVLLVDEPSEKLIPFAVSDQGQWFKSIQEYQERIASWDIRLGIGITGWVAKYGESVRLGNAPTDPRYQSLLDEVRSELCVPLRVGNHVIGVINFESVNSNAFTESDQRLLETVAAQIAIAIQNARLFKAEHQRRQEAETLRQAANALTSSLDLEDVLNGLLDGLALVVPFNSATVFLKENAGFRAIAARGFDSPEPVKGQLLSGTNELAHIVEETRRPLILPDVKTDDRFTNWGPTEKIRGWLAVPLIQRDQYIGFLTIDSYHPNAFTEANADMALAFASHAAAAIQNARLYEDAVRRMNELEALYESGLSLGKSLDPREISEKVVSVLANRLNWHHAAVRIRRGDSDDMELLAFSQTDKQGRKEKIDTGKLMAGKTVLKAGQGMAGWVVKHGRTINSGNLQDDPRYYATFPNMNSGLYVPIWAGGQTLGCISVESKQPGAFNEADERLLTTLALQAASALENARLFAAEQSRRQDAEMLRQAAAALSSSLDPEQIINELLDELSRVINFSSSTVFIQEKNGLRAISERGLAHPEKMIGQVFPSNDPLSTLIKESRHPVILPDAKKDSRFQDWGAEKEIRGWMGVPLLVRGIVIGYITLDSFVPNAYTDSDAEMALAFASYAATAIENARLYQDAVRSADRRQILHATSQEISQISQDPEQVYVSIHRAATRLMRADAFIISLLDEAKRQIDGVYLVDRNGRNPNLQIPLGQGLSSQVILSGESLLVNDDLESKVEGIHFGSQEAVRSIVAVPLRVSGKVIGAISAQSYQPGVYDDEDRLLLELLAAQAAIAIQNARLYQEALLAAERRSVLHQVSQEIARISQDSEQLYTAIYQAAARLIPTDMFTIALVNEAENQIDGAYAIDRGERGPFISFPLKMGIAGRVIETNKMLLIEDYDDPSVTIERVQFSDNQPTRSILAVPLRSGEKVIGSMSVQSYQPGRYTEEDGVLLEMLGAQATVAIENARLFEQVRRRVKEQEALNRASQALTGSLDLEPLLENILHAAKDAIAGAEKGTILLWDKDRNNLRVYTQIGYTDTRIMELPFRSEKGYSGRAFREKRPILIEDALAEYEPPFDESVEEVYTVKSGIVAPLLAKDKAIGVISLDNATKKGAFTKDDLNLLMIFASSTASVIENARLFEETRRRAEEFSSLYETARDISAEQDLNKLLNIIVERASVLLNAPISGIYLYDQIRNDVYVAVSKGFEDSIGTRLAMGEGVAGRVAQSRKPLIISDHSSWEGRSPQYEKINLRAILEVPMLYGGELVGVLTVDEINESKRRFTEDDARLLTLFASHAASAVHNARLLAETRRQADEFEALYQTAADVSSETDLKVLLNTIIIRAQTLSGASGSGLYLFDPQRNDLELVAINDPDIRPGTRLAIGEGLSGRVAQDKQPLIVNDYRTWENGSSHYKGLPITSVLGIPMLYSGELIGVLNVHNRADLNQTEPTHMFTEQDINLLSLFANAAAGAVYSARLLDKTLHRLDELAALAQVSSALRTASSRSEMMSVLLDQLMNVLHADGGNLVSNIPGRDDLLIEAARGVDAPYAGMWVPSGEGLSRRVLNSGEPCILANAQNDPSFFNPDGDNKTHAIALVPLKSQDKAIGAISMGRIEKDGIMPVPFSEDDVRLLNAIADMAANAFQRASLHEETTRYAEQLVIINDLGRSLSETLDLPHIYEKLSRAALDLLPDTATIFVSLFDANERSIKAAYGVHAGAVIGAADLPAMPFDESGNQNQSQVILSGEPLIVPDLSVSLKDKKAVRIKSGSEEQVTQSALYVPMKAEGRVIGVLHVQSYDKNRYTSADAELLELVANTAAVVIQNARLFTQLKRRVDQLSALHSVDITISSTTDLRVSLQSVLENITRQLKVDAADVLLLNPATLVLQYVAGLGFFTSEITHTALPLGKGKAGKAALERRIIHIPDLTDKDIDFAHNNLVIDERFAAYIAVPLMAKGDVKGVLEIFQRSPLELEDDWMSFLEMLAGQAALAIDNALLFEGLEKANIELTMAYDATIEGWSQALELRDQETQGHSVRVLDLTLRLAAEMGISSKDLQDIRRGVLLHDIGKMGIPDSILHKPGKLTDEEWKLMHRHPKYAYDMLAPIAYLRDALDIPYCHHEKWDGSGYPRGLSGETIPLAARIFAVVDVYDALTSDRPYRDAWSKEKSLDYIREQSGTHFDPHLVEIFLKFIQE